MRAGRIIGIFILVVLLVGVLFVLGRIHHQKGGGGASTSTVAGGGNTNYSSNCVNPPNPTPYTITCDWLAQQMLRWGSAAPYPMMFSGQMAAASYGNIDSSSIAADNANLNMLNSLGVQSIRVDMGYAPWLNNNQNDINLDNNLVSSIKSSGKQLVIADAASESYYKNKLPWSEFKTAWIQRVQTLTSLYQPDYYLVIKEPGWYIAMISDARSNPEVSNVSQWLNLTEQLAATVKRASPNTKVGISISADGFNSQKKYYDEYLQGVEKMQNISFIGFDTYDTYDLNNTQQFLQTYGSGGKQIWIAEAWSTTDPKVAFNASRSELDVQWINALYHFALTINASMISPFYSDIFASYNQRPSNATQMVSYYQGRTPIFYAYQNIITQNANPK